MSRPTGWRESGNSVASGSPSLGSPPPPVQVRSGIFRGFFDAEHLISSVTELSPSVYIMCPNTLAAWSAFIGLLYLFIGVGL